MRNGLAHSKGKGVFALKEFKKGALVCEYSGQLISKKEADKREKEYEGKPEFGCYMYYFKFKSKTMWYAFLINSRSLAHSLAL